MPDKQLPTTDLPAPVVPQPLYFRTVIDYSITANRAIIDYASRYREQVLYNRYIMGRDAIRKGSEDSWTHHPKMIERAKAELAERGVLETPGEGMAAYFGRTVPIEHFDVLRRKTATPGATSSRPTSRTS